MSGFYGCESLKDEVISSLPAWITTIDDDAFGSCGFENLVIPNTVTHIGRSAFSNLKWGAYGSGVSYPNYMTLESLSFEDGAEPLTIGISAFEGNPKLCSSVVVLPERVVSVGQCSLKFNNLDDNTHPAVKILNRNIDLSIDLENQNGNGYVSMMHPWDGNEGSIVFYPDDAAEDSDIMRLKALNEERGFGLVFRSFEARPHHRIEGRVPNGATVKLSVNGQEREVDLNGGTTFVESEQEGNIVYVVVSMDGYADYVLKPRDDAQLVDDWSFEVTAGDMTPLHTTGTLSVVVSKNCRPEAERIEASIGLNIVVLNADGKVVARGKTLKWQVSLDR